MCIRDRIHKLDQLMPLLQTLEIEEVITEKQVEQQRSRFKRIVLALSSMMRNFAMGCRRRMNEADAKKDEAEANRSKVGHARSAKAGDGSPPEGTQIEDPVTDDDVAPTVEAVAEQTSAETVT